MPEAMNHEWELAKLRREIKERKAKGENVEVLEACLSLGEKMIGKTAVTYIQMTAGKDE